MTPTELAVPSREDWGDLGVDLEVEYGYKLFGGKTVEEALPLFVENPLERSAELHFAPGRVVAYYLFCYVSHLLSPGSAGEADMASTFLRLVGSAMQSSPHEIEAVWGYLGPAVAAVAERQAFYDADESIYGSFDRLRRDIERARPEHGNTGV